MVISIALLGFAASGTFLSFLQLKKKGRLTEKNFCSALVVISFLLFVSIPVSFYLAQKIPFNPFQMVWQTRQFLYLGGYYLLFFIPFFLAGSFIGLSFMQIKNNVAQVYFYNLLGSAAGVLVAFISFYVVHPAMLISVPVTLALLGLLFVVRTVTKKTSRLIFSSLGILFFLLFLFGGQTQLGVSSYKGLSKCLQLPDAKIEYEKYSPLAFLQVLDAPSLRDAPGLSLNYEEGPPPQKAIFLDANPYGVVTEFKGNKHSLEYLDYCTFAVAYHLISPRQVLILNPGCGNQILAALYHDSEHIQGVEPQPDIVNLLRGPLRNFSSSIYDDFVHVDVTVASPREFLARHERKYDLIQLDLIGSLGGEGGGIYATSENFMYTLEAFKEYFESLNPHGILSASAWLNNPPRTFLKLLALAVEVSGRAGEIDLPRSMVAIRSWATGTVLIRREGFSLEDIARLRDFCKKRGFDLVYYPGIDEGEVNFYNLLAEPIYFETIRQLLDSSKREEIFEKHVFNITPPTDDKPYFSHYFKLSALPYLLKTFGQEWIPFLEWGYIILWGTLIQALVLAPLFVLLPLVFSGRKERLQFSGKWKIFLYFSLLGLAFMFVEMVYIQKFILLLTHPIFALALVLSTLMFFSGIGSLLSRKLGRTGTCIPFIGIMVLLCTHIFFLDELLNMFLPHGILLKCLIVVLLLAPLGIFMGMPFAMGLQAVSDTHSTYIPWVWGVNGLASVIASVLGSLLSVTLGFVVVMGLSLLLYALAGLIIVTQQRGYSY